MVMYRKFEYPIKFASGVRFFLFSALSKLRNQNNTRTRRFHLHKYSIVRELYVAISFPQAYTDDAPLKLFRVTIDNPNTSKHLLDQPCQ